MISINEIIENMPKGLSQLEKTRYIYLELGKIFSYNIEFFYAEDDKTLQDIYDEEITVNDIEKGKYQNKVSIVCKQASEILCEVLNDNRIGVESYCTGIEKGQINHVNVISKIGDKKICLGIIFDLQNIQKGFFTKSFGKHNFILSDGDECDILKDEEIRNIDKKLGYCKNGIYMDDIIGMIKKEMKDDDNFKKYIVENYSNIKTDTIKEDTILNYKVDFIYKHIKNNMLEKEKMEISELSDYYKYIFEEILTPNENMKRSEYKFYYNDNGEKKYSMISELNLDNKKVYYIYDDEQRGFINISEEDLKRKSKNMNFLLEMPECIDEDEHYLK